MEALLTVTWWLGSFTKIFFLVASSPVGQSDSFSAQIIEDLEERLSNVRASEVQSHRRELRRCKLKYEILARNELNAKLSEINAFLERRAKEQAEQDKSGGERGKIVSL